MLSVEAAFTGLADRLDNLPLWAACSLSGAVYGGVAAVANFVLLGPFYFAGKIGIVPIIYAGVGALVGTGIVISILTAVHGLSER